MHLEPHLMVVFVVHGVILVVFPSLVIKTYLLVRVECLPRNHLIFADRLAKLRSHGMSSLTLLIAKAACNFL